MVQHCAHARYVWNLALEQANYYRPAFGSTPGNAERMRQLTEARAANDWLAAGSQTVQQQALRDFDQAMRNWWGGTHSRPTWRKAGQHEGFRVVAVRPEHVRRVGKHWGEVQIPKVGWVKFRWSRAVAEAKSFRVTLDRAGRWHVGFTVIPEPLIGPGDGSIVGIDRGVTVTLALSDGTMLHAPKPTDAARFARRLSRAKRGSNRRRQAKLALARVKARDADRRKDFAEKASTSIAERFDVIRIEDLHIRNMTRSARGTVEAPGTRVAQKTGLNRSILGQCWGLFAQRLQDKAQGRVEKINPAYTSQRCHECGYVDQRNRENQAFRCLRCGHTAHADLNAARNIAAGHAVTARRGLGVVDLPVKREPQLELVS